MSIFPTPAPGQHRWRLRPGQQLAYRAWDDEYVVYNDLTGDCHLLDASGFAVLQHLQTSAPIAPAGLITALAGEFDDLVPDDPASLAEIERVLAGLLSWDLVEVLA